jgi:predicted Fe-Mo cluster-binding NifX family protein
MIIAMSVDGDEVSMHFGRCEKYILYKIKNKEIVNKTEIQNPGHKPFFLPKFLADKNVDVLITGGIGPRAIDSFNELDIKIISEVRGKVENVIKDYLEGKITEQLKPCKEHSDF